MTMETLLLLRVGVPEVLLGALSAVSYLCSIILSVSMLTFIFQDSPVRFNLYDIQCLVSSAF